MKTKHRMINTEVYKECLDHGHPDIISKIVAGRVDQFDSKLFTVDNSCLQPPGLLKDCEKAAKRIKLAIENKDRIAIYHDHDVDGITGGVILHKSLEALGGAELMDANTNVHLFSNDRHKDGYGLNDSMVKKISVFNPDLIISVDVGISDCEKITQLVKKCDADFIVTDHHTVPETGLPVDAYAVVNACRNDCDYAKGKLCGAATGWLVMIQTCLEMEDLFSTSDAFKKAKMALFQLIDYAALATVADMVSLAEPLNRYIVKQGLEIINRENRECWKKALNGKNANVGTLGFQIGPRINACSRMTGTTDDAVAFLLSDDHNQARQLWEELDGHNKDRKDIEKKMFSKAKKKFESDKDASSIVFYDDKNHSGIQGVTASTLVEKYGLPCIMLAPAGDDGKYISGSGRAGEMVNIYDCIQIFKERFPGALASSGGHPAACGLKFKTEELDIVIGGFEQIFSEQILERKDPEPSITTDAEIERKEITLENCKAIEQLAPFGIGFPTPVFEMAGTITDMFWMGRPAVHLKMKINDRDCLIFYAKPKETDSFEFGIDDYVKIVYSMNVNEFRGQESLQLIVRQIQAV